MAGITIGSNIAALQTLRQLARSGDRLEGVFTRLSSGMRINRAADDAAGLAVAMGLNTQARVYGQAVRNLNDGLSYINIADGALSELSALTTRQIELAQQAANGSFSMQQRRSLHDEANELADEFNRIVLSTRFNGLSIFGQGGGGTLALQAGFGLDGTLTIRKNSEFARTVGSGSVTNQRQITAASTVSASAVDIDNDGKLDLVSTTGDGALELRYGNGDGTFGSAVQLVAADVGGELQIADENEDGIDDILYTDGNTISVIHGRNSRSLVAISTGVRADGLWGAADLNGDGALDIVGSILTNYTVSLGTSSGYAFAQTTSIGWASQVEFGDFDADGRSEFVVGTGIYKWTDSGVAGFATSPLTGARVGDINNDGKADLLGISGGNLVVAYGTGTGSFSPTTTVQSATGGGLYALKDINGDGLNDVVKLNTAGSLLQTFLQNADGTFATGSSYAHGLSSSTRLGIFGDFDGDGTLDIGLNSETEGISLLDGVDATSTLAPQVNLLSVASAREALETLTAQLTRISAERGALGSFQSRIEAASRVIGATEENLKQAEGRIRDADVAQEAADLVRTQIAQQAGAFVLSQAKLQPALALQLLRGIAPR